MKPVEEMAVPCSGVSVRIIPYEARFYNQVVALVTGIQQHELGGGVTFEEQHDLQDIPSTYLKQNGNFWLALQADEVVGTIGLIDLGNQTGVLKKMFVNPAHRGKEKAVAQSLFQQLADWAKARGFMHLYLGTGPSLHAAHRFYERNGFRELQEKTLPSAVLDTLVRIDTKRYYKKI